MALTLTVVRYAGLTVRREFRCVVRCCVLSHATRTGQSHSESVVFSASLDSVTPLFQRQFNHERHRPARPLLFGLQPVFHALGNRMEQFHPFFRLFCHRKPLKILAFFAKRYTRISQYIKPLFLRQMTVFSRVFSAGHPPARKRRKDGPTSPLLCGSSGPSFRQETQHQTSSIERKLVSLNGPEIRTK
jgi:hypothetical protein